MDLTSLARQEKDSLALLKIPENFYTVAKLELSKQEEESLQADSELESELLRESVLTDQRALKNLIDIRIKKIIKAAVSDAYRYEPKHSQDHMTILESALYNTIIEKIAIIRQ